MRLPALPQFLCAGMLLLCATGGAAQLLSFAPMPQNLPATLIDAPSATLGVPPNLPATTKELRLDSEIDRNTVCESGEAYARDCRVSWPRILASSFFFLSAQHGGNIGMDDDARYHLLHHTDGFWGDYATTFTRYRFSRWNDDDPFGVDYIGHPLMGGLTNFIYIQNDPKQRALDFENTHRYWVGRLRATAYSAAYSAQWKIGPLSETSIGNIGIKTYYSAKLGRYTNETGMVDFFVTPVGGLLWNVGEDVLDKKLFRRITHNVRNRWVLDAASMITPAKTAANILRFRAPYYRDRDSTSPLPLRP